MVDHLGPRGLNNNCPPNNPVSVTEYAQDDVAAMKHLRALPFVDGKRIVQVGLSYGTMAGLRLASEKFRARYVGNERFAAVVSLYPWCNQQGGQGYPTRVVEIKRYMRVFRRRQAVFTPKKTALS